MELHPSNIRCPTCQGPLMPVELRCEACEISVRGRFVTNEFAALGEEDLHFLRIFVLTEGRIRDMESALGVSYPTIKSHLARLKTALTAPSRKVSRKGPSPSAEVLNELQAGRITFDEAKSRIHDLQKGALP